MLKLLYEKLLFNSMLLILSEILQIIIYHKHELEYK